MCPSSEEAIDAKVEELDRMIGELQKRRQELLEAKETMKAMVAYEKKKEERLPTDAVQPMKRTTPVSPRPPSRSDETTSTLEKTLDILQWKSFKKKEGEWTFLRDREGRLIDELQTSKDFVDRLRKENEVVIGKYRYRISEDKFLNRYLAS
jgi:hypothetical protein